VRGSWESGDGELGCVCRVHEVAVWVLNGNWGSGNALVVDRHGSGAEVSCAAGVSNGSRGV
jgi:hypothetical protein